MHALTKHPEGSLRELWSISFPLMLSSFSVMLMIFVDRLLLAHYSTSALNASVNASTLGWAFICGWMVLTGIAEVFVAQYNGAGKRGKLGEPVWQMIWLSLSSILFFLPLAVYGTSLFYGYSAHYQMERDYFRLMVLFGPGFSIYAALAGFFVGQGKTFLITVLALGTNLVNAIFDIILIFGIDGVLPSFGIKGAAIATCSSELFQVGVLACIFLNRENREKHRTDDFAFKFSSFSRCIKIGLPAAVFVVIEILGFAAYYWMMTLVGDSYITVAGICQSVLILFFFVGEGTGKAITAIVGNLIGAARTSLVPRVLMQGVRLHLIFFLMLLVFFILFKDIVIQQFLPYASAETFASLYQPLVTSLFLIIFYLLFEGIRMLFTGVLTAAGDTNFLLVAGSLSIWTLLVLPVYLIVVKGHARVEVSALICTLYSMAASAIYYWRFLEGKWKNINLLQSSGV